MQNFTLASTHKLLAAAAITTSLTFGIAAPVFSQAHTVVHFDLGSDNAFLRSSITGDHYHDYILNARAGQTMGVSLITEGTAYFNILPPGSSGEAIYNSSVSGNDATGIRLPRNGNYTIRVYLMGNDKDTDQTVPFSLSASIL